MCVSYEEGQELSNDLVNTSELAVGLLKKILTAE